jgi:hypothetical protein
LEKAAPVQKREKQRPIYYGSRKAAKLVRCYQKEELGVYRVEAGLHSPILRRNDISTLDDFINLPEIIYPRHFQFVDFDWSRVNRYWARNHGDQGTLVTGRARERSTSLQRLSRDLKRKGVVNVHRFLVPLRLNEDVRRALKEWARHFKNPAADTRKSTREDFRTLFTGKASPVTSSFDSFNCFSGGAIQMKQKHKKKKQGDIFRQALDLASDPRFLFRAGQKIGELGVVGEQRTSMITFLACVGRSLPLPPGVIEKGSTASGKSTVVKNTVLLFPPECVIERAGLSGKALAHGAGSLANKILFINEYRCGKDAQQLLRLLQSEGRIRHEFTTIRGPRRGTEIAERLGTPTVLTTTTDDKVFADDETRFLSVWVDESPSQTLAILKSKASGPRTISYRDLRVWRTAMSLIVCKEGDFKHPPAWLGYIAERVPLDKVRVRREWDRVLSFCKAVALCRAATGTADAVDITFADYCVAYRILEPALAATLHGLPSQEFTLGRTVADLTRQHGRAVTVNEISTQLGWKSSLVYKHVKRAVKHRLLEYEAGAREKNVKLLRANVDFNDGFLPTPASVFKSNPKIGSEVRYVDPFTGERRLMRRVTH